MMQERRERGGGLAGVGLLLGAAVVVVLGFAVYQIGQETLRTMGLVFVGGLTLALLIGASALPIRAWRRNDNPPVIERHFTDGTKTIVKETRVIDGRTAQTDIKLLQLPAQQQAAAFPELLRAAYQAGHAALPGPRAAGYAGPELAELDLGAGAEWETVDGWEGDIKS